MTERINFLCLVPRVLDRHRKRGRDGGHRWAGGGGGRVCRLNEASPAWGARAPGEKGGRAAETRGVDARRVKVQAEVRPGFGHGRGGVEGWGRAAALFKGRPDRPSKRHVECPRVKRLSTLPCPTPTEIRHRHLNPTPSPRPRPNQRKRLCVGS